MIYRFMDKNNELIPEKISRKPIQIHKVNHRHLTKVIDLYIFKKQGNQTEHGIDEYNMYVLFENGVILFSGVEKRSEQSVVMDSTSDGPAQLTLGCADCDYKNGVLMIDSKQRMANNNEEHFIKKYQMSQQLYKTPLEGVKEKLRFFNDHVVEVKSIAKGSGSKSSQLSIYDFRNKIIQYWTN